MADEEDTREVLFPQWMGPDKHGLTIEQKAHGEIFVTEVKEESPAAHTGRVFEGDQIVGATIYFENMSSEETAELLKTLNRHKVGLKLQHKTGDKSPCRSPMGTLSWEAQTGFGGSSPDIVLSGDDEEYRRIYTKKIKPRLKSEDLAEGVDVRTERHSSTSSDGSTITTITRRITTYTVDIPGGSGQQQIDISSPEFKLNVSEGSSAQTKLPHGSIISRVSGQEALDLGEGRVKDPKGSSEKHWSTAHVKTSFTTEGTEGSGKDLKLNRYDTGLTTAKALGGEGSSELIQYDYSVRGQGSLTSDTQTGYTDLSVKPGIGTDKNLVSNSEQLLKMKREVTISGKEAEKNIESPKVNITGAEESKGGMKMSKISVSSIEIKGPKAKSDADTVLQSEIKAAKMDIKAPGIVDPKLKLTSISGSEINIKSLKAKGEVDVSVPNVEGSKKAPQIDIRHPVVSIEGSDGGITMPEIIMPSIQLQGPKVDGPNVDASLHKADVDIKGLNIDMSTNVDIEGHKGKVKGPKVKMPSISGPNISMSDVDVNLKGSNIKSDVDISLAKVEGDIKAPKVDVKVPHVETEGPEGGFKMPKIKMPSYGVIGPKVEELDVDTRLAKAEVHVSVPEVGGDIKAPKVDIRGPQIDTEGPEGGFKMPKIKMPSFSVKGLKGEGPDVNLPEREVDIKRPSIDVKTPEVDIEGPEGKLKGPKISMPDVDFNLKGPKVKREVDASFPKLEGEIKTQKVDIRSPHVDIDGPEGKVKGPKFKVPTLSGPKISMPDVDIKGPKLKGDVDVSVPKIEGDIKAPKVDIEGPDVDVEGSGGFKMPKIKMPTFNVKSPKVEGPDIDVNLPKSDIDVKGPKIDVKCPDIDIEGPEGKIKGPKFKMPTISGPNISMPDIDFNLKGPKLKGDVDVSVPKIEGDIKAPKVDIEGPDVDIEGSGGFKMPKFKMPTFGGKGPKGEGPDIDVNLPKADIDVKGPKIDLKSPSIDIEGPEGKIKGPKFKMPTISGPNISMPDVDFNIKGPKLKGDVDVSVPKIEGDIKAQKFDIEGPDVDIEGSGGFKMPKFKMPTFGGKGPKVEGPDIDVNLPKTDIDVKGPKIDLKSPDIDIEGPEGKIKGPKFKMPTMSGPNISMPDVDFNLKGPKLKGDVDVSVPKIQGDIKAPKVDIEGPDVDVEGSAGFKMPKIKMPTFGAKFPNIEGPDIEVNLPKADLDVKGPKFDPKSPDIDFEGPEGNIKGPKFKMPTMSGPKISMPDVDFNLKGPKFKGDVDVSVPKIEGDIKAPKVDIEGPDVDIEGSGGFKMPKIKMPTFGGKVPKVEGPDIDVNLPKADLDVKGPKIDIKSPNIDIDGPEGKIKGPKFKMPTLSGPNISKPDVDFNLKGPKFKGDLDVSVPKIEGDIKAPKIDIEGPDMDIEGSGGFKMPKIKMPYFGIKGPIVEGGNAEINVPKLDADIKGPVVDIKHPEIGKGHIIDSSLEGPDADINFKGKKGKMKMPKVKGKMKSDITVDSKSGNVELAADSPDLHLKGPKVKKPLFGKLHFPDVEFDIKSPKSKGGNSVSGNSKSVEIDSSPGSLKADLPGVDIQTPHVSLEGVDIKAKKSKIKMPKLISGSKVKSADVDVNVQKLHSPEMSMNLGAPDVSLEGHGIKVEAPEIKGTFEGRVKGRTEGEGFKAEGHQGIDLNMPSGKFQVPHVGSSDVKTGEIVMHTDFAVSSATDYPEGNVTFPKIKVPKFAIASPQVEGREMGVDVGSGELSASGNVSSSLETPCPDLKSSGVKVKVKKPRFFGKSKPKGGSAADLTFQGPEVEAKGGAKVSKGLSASSGELIAGKTLEGSSGLKISPKSKSASLDLYKKSRHRSSSLSDEGELASPTSIEGHLQTESGDISMDVGGAKVKGKKGVLKFGTFGGFSSKSKGLYEVTLGEDSEAKIEGAGVVSPSKKSRVSSTSSSDSVSKGGFRFPKVEIAVSPKK